MQSGYLLQSHAQAETRYGLADEKEQVYYSSDRRWS